jgi:hypothetical protein
MARVAKVKRSGGSGLGHVQQRAKEIDAKREGSKKNWLASKLKDGDSAVLRVLDTGTDFKDGYVHPVEMTIEDDDGKERTFTADVMCLDQNEQGEPCPGCRDDLDRRYKFWTNVIVRDWEDEDSGEEKDTLMIWSGGIKLAKRLDKLNQRHDLRNRDILLEREGKKLNTVWTADWAEEEDSPLSEEDIELAKDKVDLSRYVEIRDFDDFFKSNKELKGDDNEDVGEKSVRRGSGFGAKKGKVGGAKVRRSATKKSGLASVKARADGKTTGKVKAKSTAKPKVKVRRK